MSNYPYEQAPGVEHYGNYCPGGYHPTHLGDTFKDGRYTVVNKLGFGSFSTVWLVRDEITDSLASLKISTADASEHSSGSELDVLRRSTTGSEEGKRFVLQFLDSFVHKGPNGEHLCVVTEVSGPNLATCLWGYGPDDDKDLDCLPSELPPVLALQAAKGMEYLHSCGIVHGDLHMGNLLYHLPVLSTLKTLEEFDKYFGTPRFFKICVREGMTAPFEAPHVPRYVVRLPNYTLFFQQLLNTPSLVELKICDFGQSFLHDSIASPQGIKRKLNFPNVHMAPEVIFDKLVSPASDIWALGSTMHQIMTGAGPESRTAIPVDVNYFGGGCSEDEVLCAMVRALGKFPERWWDRWETRANYFDDEGRRIGENAWYFSPKPLGGEIYAPYVGESVKEVFVKILLKIFAYEPENRLSAQASVEELKSLTSARE
ncbi:kinase-like domain-containing protein [Coprinopsis sp. MPI-PUGE-AT-0042]|nr:kinase-like domain-containing protein [Coprinopsis sp. MPI-PUGE-AT-0042]